jgi:hypothetical protein
VSLEETGLKTYTLIMFTMIMMMTIVMKIYVNSLCPVHGEERKTANMALEVM